MPLGIVKIKKEIGSGSTFDKLRAGRSRESGVRSQSMQGSGRAQYPTANKE
jgi:hypothetical protein